MQRSLKLNADNKFLSLVETTAWRYRQQGRFVRGFVRGKLLHDPVYRAILRLNILPFEGKIVDLGCGRGILLALLTTLRHVNSSTTRPLTFQGIELRAEDADVAQQALGIDATITHADIRTATLSACQAVILLDVLLYLCKQEQEALLIRIAQVLPPDGLLIIREADADADWRYWITRSAERFCALARGHWRQQYCYRSQQEWIHLLEQLGFTLETYPMSEGTPFANVLFVARRHSAVII
jgi:predicted TPR repeat methyltransferase